MSVFLEAVVKCSATRQMQHVRPAGIPVGRRDRSDDPPGLDVVRPQNAQVVLEGGQRSRTERLPTAARRRHRHRQTTAANVQRNQRLRKHRRRTMHHAQHRHVRIERILDRSTGIRIVARDDKLVGGERDLGVERRTGLGPHSPPHPGSRRCPSSRAADRSAAEERDRRPLHNQGTRVLRQAPPRRTQGPPRPRSWP